MPAVPAPAARTARRSAVLPAVLAAVGNTAALIIALFAAWACLTVVGMAAVGGLATFAGDPLVTRLGDQMALIALLPTAAIAALALLDG